MSLKTQRLELRSLRTDDFETWKDAYSQLHPPQSPFDEHPYALEELTQNTFEQVVTSEAKDRESDFAYQMYAFCRDTRALIGTSQLWNVLRFNCQRAVLGFNVLNTHWRKGYGFEIAHATLVWGFETLGLHRIEAEILPTNQPSIALCQKLGMQSEGIRRQALQIDGLWQDHAVYAITTQEMQQP